MEWIWSLSSTRGNQTFDTYANRRDDSKYDPVDKKNPPNTECTGRWGLPLRGVPHLRQAVFWLRVFPAPQQSQSPTRLSVTPAVTFSTAWILVGSWTVVLLMVDLR